MHRLGARLSNRKWTACAGTCAALAALCFTVALATESWIDATVLAERTPNSTSTAIGTVKSGLFTGMYTIRFYVPQRVKKFNVRDFYADRINEGMWQGTIALVALADVVAIGVLIVAMKHIFSERETRAARVTKNLVMLLTLIGFAFGCLAFSLFIAHKYTHLTLLISKEIEGLFPLFNFQTPSQLGYGVWFVVVATALLLVAFSASLWNRCRRGRSRRRRIQNRIMLNNRRMVPPPEDMNGSPGTLKLSELY